MTNTNEPTDMDQEPMFSTIVEDNRSLSKQLGAETRRANMLAEQLANARVEVDALKQAMDVAEQMAGNPHLVSVEVSQESATYQANGDCVDVEFAEWMYGAGFQRASAEHMFTAGHSQRRHSKTSEEAIKAWQPRKVNDNG